MSSPNSAQPERQRLGEPVGLTRAEGGSADTSRHWSGLGLSDRTRRGFLRRLLASSGLLFLPGCDGRPPSRSAEGSPPEPLDWELLGVVARDVLPTELGNDGVDEVVARFRQWIEGFEPGAERDHGYLTAELSFTPEDPTAQWAAQLRALDGDGARYAQASASERRRRLRAAIAASVGAGGTPRPLREETESTEPGEAGFLLATANAIRAPHVALALLGFFFSSPQATDLCFQVHIGPQTCRELSQSATRPR